ncbi:MAG: hypothetical protein AB1899_18570 [Pseudomonadota bacterium]
MTLSAVIAISIWAVALIPGVFRLADPSAVICRPGFPLDVAPFVLLMPFIMFGFAALKAPHSPFLVPKLAAFITARTGRESYQSFLVQFKPILFFGIGGLLDGLSQLRSCLQLEGSLSVNAHGWFFVAGGISFLVMHAILKFRKVPGV